jgi:hypothetical protein
MSIRPVPDAVKSNLSTISPELPEPKMALTGLVENA